MRLHRILRAAIDEVGEETSVERVALEEGGVLWDVWALDRVYRGEEVPTPSFFERVVASGARDLDDWAARLASGSRPRAARVSDGFTWLPPFDGERSVAVGFDAFADGERPVLLSPRAAFEHGSTAPLRRGASVLAAPAVAALLADAPEPHRPADAVLGLALALVWLEAEAPAGAVERFPGFALGPAVVSLGGARGVCQTSLRVGARAEELVSTDLEGRVLAAVVRAADAVSLAAGDLVLVPGRHLGLPPPAPARAGEEAELRVEPFGALRSRWVAARSG